MVTLLDRIIADKAAHTPKIGFAVVGVDEYGSGDGGKSLYTVAQCTTLQEARECREASIADGRTYGNHDRMLIFESEGCAVD